MEIPCNTIADMLREPRNRPSRTVMHTDGARHAIPRNRAGFSLIEILVATTILIIIVLMVSMVFHQSIASWSSGSRRADTQMVVRTITGSIQRDLVNAIDDPGNAWGDKSITFMAIAGIPEGATAPAVQEISYKFANGVVTRSVDGDKDSLNPDTKLEDFAFNYPDSWDANEGLPPCVDITLSIKTTGKEGAVAAYSAGPDGEYGTKDDIVIGDRQ